MKVVTNSFLQSRTFQRILRATINAFILFYVISVASWSMPDESKFNLALRAQITNWMNLTGLWQNWRMFAPDPRAFDTYLVAEMTYQDGAQKTISLEPNRDGAGMNRYRADRFRKWANDNVRDDGNSGLWPDIAAWIARTHTQPNHPVKVVSLVRHWSDLPSPLANPFAPWIAPTTETRHWNHYVFYTWRAEP